MNKIELSILFLIGLPFFAFALSLIIPSKKENLLSRLSFISLGLQLVVSILFVAIWWWTGAEKINLKEFTVFKSEHYEFYIDFMFDRISAVFLLVGAYLTFLITLYSRYYLHRETGYKRFFNTLLFFYSGYNLIILSGNFETLFIGWEILGWSSFLLIAFYRTRYLPVKNAVKIYSIYRIGDVGLLLAMWMTHHLWHENINFMRLSQSELVISHLQEASWLGLFISLAILLSALAKSAQLPFCSWLPRAMEGPTPSSAIFYGSLAINMGVFLLLRTMPFWEHQWIVRILIGLMGLLTAIVAEMTARVQSSVKSQIAYSSISQIGLIFIELSFGFEILALIHFAGNAFLRTYQLLVSPSVVSYLIREQFYLPSAKLSLKKTNSRLQNTLYILSLKEWKVDEWLFKSLWRPMKWVGKQLRFVAIRHALYLFIPLYLFLASLLLFKNQIPYPIVNNLPTILGLIGLLAVFKAIYERKSAFFSWMLIVFNHFWVLLAISFNDEFNLTDSLVFLSGVIPSGLLGYWILRRLANRENGISLSSFQGHVYEHPVMALAFLFACLGLSGFPISPTFIGEDLIFSHIKPNEIGLAIIIALSFVLDGIAIVRIYARIFLGPHSKNYHSKAIRSS